jgi:hypothetical protein
MTIILVPLYLLAFVALWLLATGLASVLGGWHAIAERYAAPDAFEATGQRMRFRTILFRRLPWLPARYRGCVTISLTPGALHIAVPSVFRFRHPPLLIPWTAIARCEEGSFLGFRWTDMEVRDEDPTIRIFGAAGEAVAAEWQRRDPSRAGRR